MTTLALIVGALGLALLWGGVTGRNPLDELRAALVGGQPLAKA